MTQSAKQTEFYPWHSWMSANLACACSQASIRKVSHEYVVDFGRGVTFGAASYEACQSSSSRCVRNWPLAQHLLEELCQQRGQLEIAVFNMARSVQPGGRCFPGLRSSMLPSTPGINIWVNHNDHDRVHPKWWFMCGIAPEPRW